MRGAARTWCPAEPDDLMRGSASDGRSLVHYGLLAGRSPHPSASRPPSPSGKALVRTVYHKKVQLFKLVLRKQSLPQRGRWAGHQPGSDEGDLPKGIGRVLRQHPTPQNHPSNPFCKAELHDRKAPNQIGSGLCLVDGKLSLLGVIRAVVGLSHAKRTRPR